MGASLDKLTIRGFKSIEALADFELGSLNVMIGANGAGKSNFVDFFRMLRALADESFQVFVNGQGGGDGLLYLGPKATPKITAELSFGVYEYQIELVPTAGGTLQIGVEAGISFDGIGDFEFEFTGRMESALKARRQEKTNGVKFPGGLHHVYDAISDWTVYHFHDTTPLSPMRRDQPVRDWDRFRHDASNIAPFLSRLAEHAPESYQLIRDTVKSIAPFFDDFLLRTQKRGADEQVRLEWRQKGTDFPFQPNHLSDGTIRFICLVTALLQPSPPSTIVIDEPELGLHPYAISILADLIRSAAERTQVIISTQSPTLLDYFESAEIIVVNRESGRSTFQRLDSNSLSEWKDDYSVAELWRKNVVRGGPTFECAGRDRRGRNRTNICA